VHVNPDLSFRPEEHLTRYRTLRLPFFVENICGARYSSTANLDLAPSTIQTNKSAMNAFQPYKMPEVHFLKLKLKPHNSKN